MNIYLFQIQHQHEALKLKQRALLPFCPECSLDPRLLPTKVESMPCLQNSYCCSNINSLQMYRPSVDSYRLICLGHLKTIEKNFNLIFFGDHKCKIYSYYLVLLCKMFCLGMYNNIVAIIHINLLLICLFSNAKSLSDVESLFLRCGGI